MAVLADAVAHRDTPVLLVGAPILSPDGRRAGTDIAAFTLDRLRDLLPMTDGYSGDMQIHLINVAERRAVHVHDADTALLATPDWHPLFAALRQASDLPLHAVRLPEHERLGALVAFARPLPEHGDWAIALLSPRDVLYAGARAELLWPLLGILLLGLAGGGLIFMLARPLLQRMLEQSQSLGLAASVFEHSNEGILLLDERQRIIGLNPAGSRLLRCRLAELEGRRACEALLLDTSEADCAAMWAQVSRTGSWQSEVTLLRGDGEAFSAWLSLAAIYDEQRRPSHFTGLFTDISAAKEEQERILQMAYHDRLTGLPNRSLVRDRLTQALRQARRQGSLLAVLFLDLDRFKPVNDTFGHAVGDLLLRAVAERLAQTVRDSDTVARLGGDEFLIVLEDLDDVAMAERIAGRHGVPVTGIPELREIKFGEWEGLTYRGIGEKWPDQMARLYSHPDEVVIPGGETFRELKERAAGAVDRLVEKHPEDTIAVVSHGGTIRTILCATLNIPLNHVWNIRQDNTAVNIIDYYGDRAIVSLVNDTHHLVP